MTSYISQIEITEEKYLEMCDSPVGKNAKRKLKTWKTVQVSGIVVGGLTAALAFVSDSKEIAFIGAVFAAAFAYKLFFQRKSVNKKRYANIRASQTEDKWQRRITFADGITVDEANTSTHFKYSDFKWVGENKTNYLLYKDENYVLRVEKGSFIHGDETKFFGWIKNKIE